MIASDSRSRSFERFRAFTQALAHRLRTPLSVISNDLVFYKSNFKSEEFDRDIRRCKELSDLLSYVASFFVERQTNEELNLAKQFEQSNQLPISPYQTALTNIYAVLFDDIPVTEVTPQNGVVISAKAKSEVAKAFGKSSFDSFTALIFDTIGRDVIDAPIIDTVNEAERISVKISCIQDILKIELWR